MQVMEITSSIFSEYRVHPISQASEPNPGKRETPREYCPIILNQIDLETGADGKNLIKPGNLDLYI